MTIEQAVLEIKHLFENTIIEHGNQGRNKLIRTSKPIRLIHEAVKQSFIDQNVNPKLIYPALGQSKGELKLMGQIKSKNQDVCLVNPHLIPEETIIDTDLIDHYGRVFTEYTLSVNVRSQMTSIAKNFDAIYERTFAEALNLHLRCPSMVLGEVFMIPVREYDPGDTLKHIIRKTTIKKHVEKYIKYFSLLNLRNNIETDYHKYERVCLLLVDFTREIPVIYNTTDELIRDNLLPRNSTARMDNLSFTNFTEDLLKIYYNRYSTHFCDDFPEEYREIRTF